MYVCICKGVTDRQIRRAIDDGAHSVRCLRRELDVCTDCGKCAREVRKLLADARAEHRSVELAVPA